MELKDFIKGSLVQICEGISDAQYETMEKLGNGPIAPVTITNSKGELEFVVSKEYIEFDIAVNVTENAKIEAGAEVGFKLLAKGKTEGTLQNGNESNHRIKFSIPFYPQGATKLDNKKNKK